jgi:ABC-type Zn2+ transport system substrate-binding protein/surface adhesin
VEPTPALRPAALPRLPQGRDGLARDALDDNAPDHRQGHRHGQRPDHAHDHAHDHTHDHAHGHAHDPSLIAPPGFSLLRLSAGARLAGALALAGAIWAGVWWAL